MSDVRDRAMAIATLVEAFGVKGEDFKPVRTRAYDEALRDIPIPLLNAAVRKAITERAFFPKVAELRADAESCRKELIQAHPYTGCCECEDSHGWRKVHITRSGELTESVTVERCPCHKRHQELMFSFGVTSTPLALPSGRGVEVDV